MDQVKYEQMMRRSEKRRLRDLRRQERSRRAEAAKAQAPAIVSQPIPQPIPQPMQAQPRQRRRRGRCGGCGQRSAAFKSAVESAKPPAASPSPTVGLQGRSSRPPAIMPRK